MQILVHSKTVGTMGTRTGRKSCTEEMKYAIVNIARAGVTQTKVAIHFPISRSTVSKILKRLKDNENCIKNKRGPKFKLSKSAIRMIQRILLKNNKKPLYESVNEFRMNYGYKFSIKTVRKYVYECGLRNYAAVSKTYLLPRHVLARKRWADLHLNWDIIQWGRLHLVMNIRVQSSLLLDVREFGGSKEEGARHLI